MNSSSNPKCCRSWSCLE